MPFASDEVQTYKGLQAFLKAAFLMDGPTYAERGAMCQKLMTDAWHKVGYDGDEPITQRFVNALPPAETGWYVKSDEKTGWCVLSDEETDQVYYNSILAFTFTVSCRGNSFIARMKRGNREWRATDRNPEWEEQYGN